MNPDQTINLNANAAQCIHSADHFGTTIYYNICAHTETAVPWGGADWAWWLLGYGTVSCLVIATLAWIVIGAFMFWSEI